MVEVTLARATLVEATLVEATPVEATLVEAWHEVLGGLEVGMTPIMHVPLVSRHFGHFRQGKKNILQYKLRWYPQQHERIHSTLMCIGFLNFKSAHGCIVLFIG